MSETTGRGIKSNTSSPGLPSSSSSRDTVLSTHSWSSSEGGKDSSLSLGNRGSQETEGLVKRTTLLSFLDFLGLTTSEEGDLFLFFLNTVVKSQSAVN
jgi:hypothetical protein